VPDKIRDTIHGRVRIGISVTVDPSGNVSAAQLATPATSRYFADAALQASRGWKFAPAAPSAGPRNWILNFVFERENTQVRPVQVNR
jgi:TonB family protein